mgnify:CR=1 FL=1
MSIIQLAESFGLTEGGELKGSTNAAHRRLNPARAKALTEAAALWGKAWNGDKMAAVVVNEALSTSDLFKSATGDLLDRELLGVYQDTPGVWNQFASRSTVRAVSPGGRHRARERAAVAPRCTAFIQTSSSGKNR